MTGVDQMSTSPLGDTSHVAYQPLGHLAMWDGNYRESDVEAIARSIARFGFNGALKVWNGIVVAGNHTLKALRRMELEHQAIPKHVVADESGGWLVPCIDVSHLSEGEAQAFAVADNETVRRWIDPKALRLVLSEVFEEDPSLKDSVGLDPGAIAALMETEEEAANEGADLSDALGDVLQDLCPHCGKDVRISPRGYSMHRRDGSETPWKDGDPMEDERRRDRG